MCFRLGSFLNCAVCVLLFVRRRKSSHFIFLLLFMTVSRLVLLHPDAVNVVLESIDEIQFLQDTPWIRRDVESMSQVLSDTRLHSLLTVCIGDKRKCCTRYINLVTIADPVPISTLNKSISSNSTSWLNCISFPFFLFANGTES